MGILVLNWQTASRHGEAWISQHRLRHRLFVDRQGWRLPAFHGLEYDQFDTPAAVYLLWLDAAGQARGMVRLIPTTRPYMVQSLWPHLLDHPCPVSARLWEATRFGCDRDLPAGQRRRILAELICASHEFALLNGIARYLAVMPRWIFERVLARQGCRIVYAHAAPPACRTAIAAAYIDISAEALAQIRTLTGCRKPVLRGCARLDCLLAPADAAAPIRGRKLQPAVSQNWGTEQIRDYPPHNRGRSGEHLTKSNAESGPECKPPSAAQCRNSTN